MDKTIKQYDGRFLNRHLSLPAEIAAQFNDKPVCIYRCNDNRYILRPESEFDEISKKLDNIHEQRMFFSDLYDMTITDNKLYFDRHICSKKPDKARISVKPGEIEIRLVD